MVSGLVTSPWDQERIFSGLARLIRMESKSAIWLARSYGLLRYKAYLLPPYAGDGLQPKSGEPRAPRRIVPGLRDETPGRGSVRDFFRGLLALHQLDVQAERLQLAHQDVERFGNSGVNARLALHNGLVNLGAAVDVVRLAGQQFLQDVGGAVGLERPDFHFAEALAAELRLTAEGLLG